MSHNRNDLGKMLKTRRLRIPLTLQELADKSGVSQSSLSLVERGKRFPSAHILRKIAEPLGFEEADLFHQAGFLTSVAGTEGEHNVGQLDPYVARVLSQEPVEMQHTVIGILRILKSSAKGRNDCDIEFVEYAHRRYPEVDEDVITMIEDILEHPRGS